MTPPVIMRKLSCLFFLSLLLSVFNIQAAEENNDKIVQQLLHQAATARDAFDDNKALSLYQLVLTKDSNNLDAIFNIGIIIQRKGWIAEETSKDLALDYYRQAKLYADKAYRLYPNSFEANLSMAGTIGRLAKYGSAKERVQAAWDIKKYADAAYRLKPTEPHLVHLLAWWNFELSKPTWFERSMASMLFGGLPKDADVQRGVQLMLYLVRINPNYIVYGYDLARFYEYLGEKTKAVESLKRVIALTPHAPEEFYYLKSARDFLNKLQ